MCARLSQLGVGKTNLQIGRQLAQLGIVFSEKIVHEHLQPLNQISAPLYSVLYLHQLLATPIRLSLASPWLFLTHSFTLSTTLSPSQWVLARILIANY